MEEPERYFENAFLIDVQKFTLNFIYPGSHPIVLVLYTNLYSMSLTN